MIKIVINIIIAFVLNCPLGFKRERTPKFSGRWWLWIHASIPVMVFLRIRWQLPLWVIPFSIGAAVAGQIAGGYWSRKRMSPEDENRLQHIPDLHLTPSVPANIADEDVLVVLLNMGGPRTNGEVREFLRNIFRDPFIIRFPLSFVLQPLFAWLLVTFRGQEAERRYQLIGGASPIFEATRRQALAVTESLRCQGRRLEVSFSFNYSEPFPATTIREARDKGKKYLLPVSLYPHFSMATTGSNRHYLNQAAMQSGMDIQFLTAPPYYLHEGYLQAFIDRINEAVPAGVSLDDFYILFSAHGLPLYFLTEGDPYPFQISQTVAAILTRINRTSCWAIAYQSDVGPLQWLKPSTENMLRRLGREGVCKVLVVPISFVTDHIETLCEIDIEYRQMAESAGVEDFRMSRAIECHPGFIQALADTVTRALPSVEASSQLAENLQQRL